MSDDSRMVLKMETILALWTNREDAGKKGLLEYLTGRELCDCSMKLAAPLAKAWLASKLPALMDVSFDPAAIYNEWLAAQCKRLGGENVSVPPIPAAEMEGIVMVMDKVHQSKHAVEEMTAKVKAAEAAAAELAPFKAKAASLEKEAAQLKTKVEGLTKEVADLKTQVAGFKGKIPVAETDINDTIKDIVTKALKDAVASVPLGAVAGAAGAAGSTGADAGAGAEAAVVEETSSVPDDFGFGASGPSNDGFGF